MLFYVEFYLNKIDNGDSCLTETSGLNMYQLVLAISFIIEVFKISIYHAPMLFQFITFFTQCAAIS